MSEPIASDAEIEAALEEAERDAARIPDLDQDGRRGEVVPVPVAVDHSPPPQTHHRASRTRSSAPPDDPPRIVVVQRLDDEAPSTAARAAWWHPPPFGAALYQAADSALTAIHLPFRRLSTSWRNLIGLLAVVTILVSVLCWVALPLLFPPRDPISVLQQKTAGVRNGIEAAPPCSPR